jgi:hypothetical protein
MVSKHNSLVRRLIDRQDDHLRFTLDPPVSFDSNAAEREVRMIKLSQKVSGCLRTLTGTEQFATIHGYLATAAKHGHPLLRCPHHHRRGPPLRARSRLTPRHAILT